MSRVLRLELRRVRGLLLALTIATAGYAAVMAWFWPIMRENSKLIDQYMTMFPSGMLAAFGMDGSLADPGVFFTTYIGSWLWPIMAALIGIVIATRPVAVDLERGFLDLPLATGLSRVRYLSAVTLAHVIALAVLAVVTVFAFFIAASIVGAPYEAGRMALVALVAWLFACAITASASVLSVVTLSRGWAGGIVAIVLLAMYLLNVVAQMDTNLAGLADLSALHYFRPTALIDKGEVPLLDIGLFALIAIAAWTAAIVLFRRRNLAA